MEYSLEFGENLIDAANSFVTVRKQGDEVGRTILYLSLLSCEVTLKALLESAGFSVKEITKRSHNISKLVADLCRCQLLGKNSEGTEASMASEVLSKVVVKESDGTVGKLLKAQEDGASIYPNEIRYGDLIKHYKPRTMLECAKVLSEWASENIRYIKRK